MVYGSAFLCNASRQLSFPCKELSLAFLKDKEGKIRIHPQRYFKREQETNLELIASKSLIKIDNSSSPIEIDKSLLKRIADWQ